MVRLLFSGPKTQRSGQPAPESGLRTSGLPLLVSRVANRIEEIVCRGDAVGAIDDRAILADDEDRAIDSTAVDAWLARNRLQRSIFGGELQIFVNQQVERQLEMDLEALVAVEVVAADAEWNGIEISIGVDCPANRGQLVRSARCEIFGIEDQEDAVGAEIIREGDRRAPRTIERKVDGWIPNLWSRKRLIGHVGILYALPLRPQWDENLL